MKIKTATLQSIKILTLVLTFGLVISGCLATNGSTTSTEASSSISSSDFAGASTAVNKGGPIQISWTLPTAQISGFRVYRVGGGGNLTSIAFVKSTDTSYIDSDTTSGQLYKYIVRAVDTADIEEKNTKQVASIAYPGLYEASITGQTTATLGLVPSVGAIDEVKVYAQIAGSTNKIELATVSPNQTSVDVSGLKNGTKYNFTAQARNIELDLYDGNENAIVATTDSKSFSGFSTGEYVFRGFMTIKAFGNAPGAATDPYNVNRIAKTRKVVLIAPPFQGYSNRSYKIVRLAADQGQVFDINTKQVCTPTTISACVPCGEIISITYDAKSSPRVYCEDTNVDAPPAKYQYAISMYDTDGTDTWLEQLPNDYQSFLTTVHIPPDNMVLAHRDSINYDTCKVMGRESDPKNKQRCAYTGIGATTYSSGPEKPPLNLEPFYYDFGYNLFVDRWEAACNWTTQASGGMCGPGGTPGECIGKITVQGLPAATIGKNGDIFYNINNSQASGWRSCFIKKSGVWNSISDAGFSTTEMQSFVTNDPALQGGHRPPVMFVSRSRSQELCQTVSDPVYGKKRLPRLREARAYNPLSWIPGEAERSESLVSIEDATTGHIGGPSGPYSCNTRMGTYINGNMTPTYASTSFLNSGFLNLTNFINTTLAQMLMPGWDFANYGFSANASNQLITNNNLGSDSAFFFIGSLHTSDCVSRFGVQDAIGNVGEYVSDIGSWVTTPPYHWSFNAPSDDVTNTDLVGFKFNGIIGLASPQSSDTSTTTNLNNTGQYSYISVPLGLPRINSDSGEATPASVIASASLALHGNDQFVNYSPRGSVTDPTKVGNMATGGHASMGGSAGRWRIEIQNSGDYGFRCVLPAE